MAESAAAMAAPRPHTTPFIGSKISLISNSNIRYEGILYTVNTQDATIALTKVRSYGTEQRPSTQPVGPHNELFEYIVFRASDIADLMVCGHSNNPTLTDPAIVSASTQNRPLFADNAVAPTEPTPATVTEAATAQPLASTTTADNQPAPPHQSAAASYSHVAARALPPRADHASQSSAAAGEGDCQGQQYDALRSEIGHGEPTARYHYRQRNRNRRFAGRDDEDGDFDFEAANEQFALDMQQLKLNDHNHQRQHNKSMSKCSSKGDAAGGEDAAELTDDSEAGSAAYDARRSFFDSISNAADTRRQGYQHGRDRNGGRHNYRADFGHNSNNQQQPSRRRNYRSSNNDNNRWLRGEPQQQQGHGHGRVKHDAGHFGDGDWRSHRNSGSSRSANR